MEYMELPEANPGADGLCSDNACPCGYPGAKIPRGSGYVYISKEVADFRRDAPTVREAQRKIARLQQQLGGGFVMFNQNVVAPLLVCELGARKRGLDLEVAGADARHWWKTGLVPLRPTPLAGSPESQRERARLQPAPQPAPAPKRPVPPKLAPPPAGRQESALRCAGCGAAYAEGARFCMMCGSTLPASPPPMFPAPPPRASPAPGRPAAAARALAGSPAGVVREPRARPPRRPGFPVTVLLIGLAGGAILVAALLLVLLSPGSEGAETQVPPPTATRRVVTVVVTPKPPSEQEGAPPAFTLLTARRFVISAQCDAGSQPSVYGDHVVWAHGTSLYVFDLTTQEETLIASEETDHLRFAGDLVVWPLNLGFWGYRPWAEDAQAFSIAGFQGLPLVLQTGDDGRLLFMHAMFSLSDRAIVWSDSAGKQTRDILAYDLEHGERVRITDDAYDQMWPAAAGSLVVWSDERNDGGDIYAYSLDARVEFPIATAPLTQTMPGTDGRHVVWIDGRDGNDDLHAYDLETQSEFAVVTGPNLRVMPGVWGNVVIWTESVAGAVDLYGFDLRLGAKFPIATEGGRPSDAHIWGDVVVWRDYLEGDEGWAIYGAALEY